MKLPNNIEFKAVAFYQLVNRGHRQVFKNEEYGITSIAEKIDRDHPWTKAFIVDRFPGKVFKSGKEVIEAFESIKPKLVLKKKGV